MKIQLTALLLAALLCSQGVQAFTAKVPTKAGSSPQQKTVLQGHRNMIGPATVTAMGWALASQIAVAGMLPPPQQDQQLQQQLQQSSASTSTLVAVEKLDYALPSYESMGTAKGGFGEGTEARLGLSDSMIDPGANEKAKQAEAMKKAEEARLEKKRADKKRREDQYEADLKKQELKKADTERRIKELFE